MTKRWPKTITIPYKAELLDQVRKEAGFTMEWLAEKANISVDNCRRYLRDGRIMEDVLEKLVYVLNRNQEKTHYVYNKKIAMTKEYFIKH